MTVIGNSPAADLLPAGIPVDRQDDFIAYLLERIEAIEARLDALVAKLPALEDQS